jgi:hypothetical protein
MVLTPLDQSGGSQCIARINNYPAKSERQQNASQMINGLVRCFNGCRSASGAVVLTLSRTARPTAAPQEKLSIRLD